MFVLFSHICKVLGVYLSLFFVAVEFVFVHSDFGFQVKFILLPDSHDVKFSFFLYFDDLLFHVGNLVHEGLVFDIELSNLFVGISVL